jgi:phosphoserine phosphatase
VGEGFLSAEIYCRRLVECFCVKAILDDRATSTCLGKRFDSIVDAQSIAKCLEKIRTELRLSNQQIISAADDLKMLTASGRTIAFHAKSIVREKASYSLNYCGLDKLTYLFD